MARKPDIETCVYCGKLGSITREHVFPMGLFPKGEHRPSPPIIVPACKPCNNRKARDDSYMRDVLNADLLCDGHPIVRQNLSGPINRSMRNGHSDFAKSALRQAVLSPLFSEGGIYIGAGIKIPLKSDSYQRWHRHVCRGLHFHHWGERIPDSYEFQARRIYSAKRVWTRDYFMSLNHNGPYCMNSPSKESDKVVAWLFLFDETDRFRTEWLIWFYESIFVQISTGPLGSFRDRSNNLLRSRLMYTVPSTTS